MAVINTQDVGILEISRESLLENVLKMKKQGLRLSQICASYLDGKTKLSYSFADDETYDYYTLRIVMDPDEHVPSITEVFPAALFYENEIKELFGVRVDMISLDYENKLYRIAAEEPFLPEEGKKIRAEKDAAKLAAEAAAEEAPAAEETAEAPAEGKEENANG